MRRAAGQVARHTGRLAHRVCGLLLVLVVLVCAGLGALAWRLGRSPIDLTSLLPRLERIANDTGEPTHLAIGGASLAWAGFNGGAGQPIVLVLTDVRADATDGARVLDVPRVAVAVSVESLLTGSLRPRTIELDRPRLRAVRGDDGAVSLDIGRLGGDAPDTPADAASPFASLLEEIEHPAATDAAPRLQRFSQLRRLRIVDASLTVTDRPLGLVWRAPSVTVNLNRRPRGGVDGEADLQLVTGDASARLTISATQSDGGRGTHLVARVTPVRTAALASAAPALDTLAGGALSALDAPVHIDASADLGPDFGLVGARVSVAAEAGTIARGAEKIPLGGATVEASLDRRGVTVNSAKLVVGGHDATPPTTIGASGTVTRNGGRVAGTVKLDLDHVAMADLPTLWPAGIADHARDWVLANMTAGTAHDALVEAAVEVLPDWSDVVLTHAGGTVDADDVTLWWLRPVPPVAGIYGRLTITDPDTLDVQLLRGRQMMDAPHGGLVPSGIASHSGHVRLTGIAARHQFADIAADLAGPAADTIALLKNKRLKLFDHHPLDLRDPAGQVTGHLTIHLPLENNVSLDDIPIHATGRVDGARLVGIAAGRTLDQGAVTLDVTNNGMRVAGTAAIAGVPAKIAADMDFRAGPPSQVIQTITVSGRADAADLARQGMDAGPLLAGSAGIEASYAERRDGRADVRVDLDLGEAALTAAPIGWVKPAGTPATGALRARLDHGHLTAVDTLRLTGPGLDVSGTASMPAGGANVLRFDRIVLGRSRAAGSVRFPGVGAGPIVASITGDTLDLSARLTHTAATTPAAPKAADDRPGPPWVADLDFGTALMAHDHPVSGLRARAENDGRVIRALRLDGRTGPRAPFHMDIASSAGARSLTASASDAGALLRAFDLVGTMQGGALSVRARWDDSKPDRPLSGVAEIADFRLLDAPVMGRLLQALSLYGVADLMRGPGLGFTKLVAPFTLTEHAVELADARAFSSSLGITARGRVDLDRNTAAIEGTVVPSYALNTLPGRIPVIGKLFSPEKSGGLFAAKFAVEGPLGDPHVTVDPLSALAPGALRNLFSGF